jgi:phospholipid/cholesterol/gamma-HCH transport system substrate-binding protein
MERTKKSHWKLGAIVAIVLIGFVFFVFYIGANKKLFTSTISLSALFPDASGVAPGNSVRMAGIEVGTVTEIAFVNDSSVLVYTEIEEEYQAYIKADSKMSIGSDGLLGDKVINILRGHPDSKMVQDGSLLTSVRPFDPEKLMASAQRTAANALVISKEFAKVSRQLNGTSGALGRYLNDPSFTTHISKAMKNFNQISSDTAQEQE